MDKIGNYLISKEDGKLQIPYSEYEALISKLEDAEIIQLIKSDVLDELKRFLQEHAAESDPTNDVEPQQQDEPVALPEEPAEEQSPEKVSVEFAPEEQAVPEAKQSATETIKRSTDVPPVKKEVEDYFNAHDASGRLLNVFMQYYTCLNESCQGVVRVTMKDGICSFWNYDKWEEFAFVDAHESQLRFTMNPRYREDLSSFDFCEVTRLLEARGSYVSTKVEDLSKTMLEVLTRAFDEVGLTAG